MSEEEKKRRHSYREKRKLTIKILAALLLAALLFTLIFSLIYSILNKAYYITYMEDSRAGYTVKLKDNEFFTESSLGDGRGYVSELVDTVTTTFDYALQMNASGVSFNYTYQVDAILEITDNATGKVIYNPVYNLKPRKTMAKRGNSLQFSEGVTLNYHEYNQIAESFVNTYKLSGTTSRLLVQMSVDVVGSSQDFANGDNQNRYTCGVSIPLGKPTIDITTTKSIPSTEGKVLSHNDGSPKTVFAVLSVFSVVLTLGQAVVLVVYIYRTRNTDIAYDIKLQKLLASYKSYIQRINNPFDDHGYQLLFVNTFSEMLEIRDTIQSPILMNENEDKTCSRFLIPTNTKILYVFELKVDDYDEIYGLKETPSEEISPVSEDVPETADVVIDKSAIGTEVIDVVWSDEDDRTYKYDPNGEHLKVGDIVLVPTRDAGNEIETEGEATVSKGNYRIPPEHLKYPLKKVIRVISRDSEKIS